MQVNSVSSTKFESKNMLRKVGLGSILTATLLAAGSVKASSNNATSSNAVVLSKEPSTNYMGDTFVLESYSTDTIKPGKQRLQSKGDEGVSGNVVTRMYGEQAKKNNEPIQVQEPVVVKEEVPVKETPKEEIVQTGKDPFNAKAFNDRINNAKSSADIVKAQTDALNIGIDLRNRATKVDLAEMQKYSGVDKNGNPTDEWSQYVRRYVENSFMRNNNIENTEVKGIEYDVNKASLRDRILNDTDNNDCTLQEVMEKSSLPEHLRRETATGDKPGINLSNVEGVNVLNLENLTLENTNEQIGKVGSSLSLAASKIDESLEILGQKLKASKENINDQNKKIATQIITANSARNIIKSYVSLSRDDQEFLTDYVENKNKVEFIPDAEGNEISADEVTSYGQFGRWQFAREARDKEIITNQFDNIRFGKTQDGQYVWDYVNIPADERKSVESAMTRLMNKYPNIKTQMQSFASASEQITKSRQGVIDGLKDVAKYEILEGQLGEIKRKLTDKSSELLLISQNLEEIDAFYEDAKNIEEKAYETEKNKLAKATDRADYKVGRTDEKGNASREVLGEDDDNTKFDASKDNRRSKKAKAKAEEGQKESNIAAERVITQREAEAAVKKHDRAAYDRDDALELYKPLSAKAIKSDSDVPEDLREQYKAAKKLYSDCNFEIYGKIIRVKDKVSGEIKYQFDGNTSISEIK